MDFKFLRCLLPVCVLGFASMPMFGAPSNCQDLPHADHPKTVLSKGDLELVTFLPDPKNGYYRGARFDWSGVVGCLSYRGHSFWGEWFQKYDPLLHDSITGPVEEFRSDGGALGYADARPGDLFVKVGVGVLRKLDESTYSFGVPYELVDSGKWTARTRRDAAVFQQVLKSSLGINYRYTKTLRIDSRGDAIVLEHRLENLGPKPIETDVYDHDFLMLDNRPTGPGMQIRLGFAPKVSEAFDPEAVKIEGKEITYLKELQPRQTVAGYITGYSDKLSDYDIQVIDHASGIGVEQTADRPISKFYLWSIRSTISPEAYIHLNIKPGEAQTWSIRYRFWVE